MTPELMEDMAKVFPFSALSDSQCLKVPDWCLALLYQYYTLKDVLSIIKNFNSGFEFYLCKNPAHRELVSSLIIEDLDIQPFSEFQYKDNQFMRTCAELEILIDDQETEPNTYQIEVNRNVSVYDLKRTILMANGNKPFFLEYNISNSSFLFDLQEMIEQNDGKKANPNQIKIYEKMDVFNLTLRNKSNQ